MKTITLDEVLDAIEHSILPKTTSVFFEPELKEMLYGDPFNDGPVLERKYLKACALGNAAILLKVKANDLYDTLNGEYIDDEDYDARFFWDNRLGDTISSDNDTRHLSLVELAQLLREDFKDYLDRTISIEEIPIKYSIESLKDGAVILHAVKS